MVGTVRGNWPAVKVQLWSIRESQFSRDPISCVMLDRGSTVTLHEQLELGLRESVRSGRLAPGARLPSSRALADELGVSRGVVLEAYAQLTAEGYLTSSQGAPTRVASTTSIERPPVPAGSLSQAHELDFAPRRPTSPAFPRDAWMRSLGAPCAQRRFGRLAERSPRRTRAAK